MAGKTVMTFHEKYRQYDLGEGHPFRGDRFLNAMRFFEEHGLLSRFDFEVVQPQPASREDLLRVHSEGYVDRIFGLAKERRPWDVETPVSPKTLEAALIIVGGDNKCGKSVF
ncbi:MAG: hypothetical protein QXJ02_05860 [Candidatus Bathyarchaeia archaeon]